VLCYRTGCTSGGVQSFGAINRAQEGGWYREGTVVDKRLHIEGDGDRKDIVVLGDGKAALEFRATTERVSNMSLRQVNREAQTFAVTNLIRNNIAT